MKLLLMLAALAAIVLPGAAYAQAAPDTKLDAENLLVKIPNGFVVGDRAEVNAGLTAAEFIPSGETVQDWSSMVTVQVLHGSREGPDKFAEHLKLGWEGACANSKVDRLGGGKVNGYRYVAWSYGCPLNPQTKKPETMWLKVVRGKDALYVVQYAFRALPSDEFEKTANGYLAGVSVCDTRDPNHPCPPGK